jgi:hypothetical protein
VIATGLYIKENRHKRGNCNDNQPCYIAPQILLNFRVYQQENVGDGNDSHPQDAGEPFCAGFAQKHFYLKSFFNGWQWRNYQAFGR